MYYELAHPKIAELLAIARIFLADTLAARRDQIDALDASAAVGNPE